MNKWKTVVALGTLSAMLVLAGCSSAPDKKEDPLSQFGVDSMVPFATKDPSLATQTPQPTATATATPVPAATLNWQDEKLDDKIEDNSAPDTDEEEPKATPKPKATTKPKATEKPKATAKPTAAPEYMHLKSGSKGERVKKLQKRLAALGYMSGSADGIYGSQTVTAVKRFQKAIEVKQNGEASVSLQKKLFSKNAPKYKPEATAKPKVTPTPKPKATPTPKPSTSEYTRLEPGATGNAVKKLQKRLIELGYLDGSATGNYLSKTTAAVKAFQKAVGVKADGIARVGTQEKLFSKNAPAKEKATKAPDKATQTPESEYKKLKRGSTGEAVKKLQRRLKELGYFNGDIGGNYLDKTVAAVKAFQKAVGIKDNGVATVATQEKLFSKDAPAQAKPTAAPQEPTKAPESEYKKLKQGDTGDRVKKLQKRLKELGYFDGDVGGNYLKKTTAAVKAFQKAIGVEADGVASVKLQERLFADDAPSKADPAYTELKNGDTGSEVKNLQKRLKELGYFDGDLGGNYLKKTTAAVKAFQKAAGLEEDGIASVELQELLFSQEAPKAD